MPPISVASLFTLSGVLAIAASVLYVLERRVAASALLIMAGSGGTAVAWDRWSRRTGEHVNLAAFLNPAAPSSGELATLATHFPLLVLGLVLLVVTINAAAHD